MEASDFTVGALFGPSSHLSGSVRRLWAHRPKDVEDLPLTIDLADLQIIHPVISVDTNHWCVFENIQDLNVDSPLGFRDAALDA